MVAQVLGIAFNLQYQSLLIKYCCWYLRYCMENQVIWHGLAVEDTIYHLRFLSIGRTSTHSGEKIAGVLSQLRSPPTSQLGAFFEQKMYQAYWNTFYPMVHSECNSCFYFREWTRGASVVGIFVSKRKANEERGLARTTCYYSYTTKILKNFS